MPLADLRRSFRSDMRPVFKNYKDGLDFRRKAANWSEDQKREWILKTLRFAVRRAAKETDYYQNLFKKIGFDVNSDFSFEDYSKLPVLEREQIHQAGESLISKAVPRENLQKDATGGSTGTPTEIWLGAEELGWKEGGLEHTFDMVGVPRDSKMAYFWGHHLDPQATDSLRDRLRSFVTNTRWFDCFRLSPEVFQKYHEEFEEWSPDCIVAYASALGHFAEYLKEKGISPKNYPKKCFVTGAEKLFPEHEKRLKKFSENPFTSVTADAISVFWEFKRIRKTILNIRLIGRGRWSNRKRTKKILRFWLQNFMPMECRCCVIASATSANFLTEAKADILFSL